MGVPAVQDDFAIRSAVGTPVETLAINAQIYLGQELFGRNALDIIAEIVRPIGKNGVFVFRFAHAPFPYFECAFETDESGSGRRK